MSRDQVNLRPIKLPGFVLDDKGLHVVGEPTFEQYEAAGGLIRQTHQASGWWLADWIVYGESRPEWADKIDAAIGADMGISEATVRDYRYVDKRYPTSNRIDGVSFSHHHAVAAYEPEERKRLLSKAQDEGWSVSELGKNARASRRTRVTQGQAQLKGMYRVLYADPPWPYRDAGATRDGSLGKAERHYPTMSMEEIAKLPVEAHAMEDAILFLWVPAPMLLVNPGPRDVIERWGFTYKTQAVWDKVLGNFGHYFRVRHENLLVCTRGSCTPDVPTPMTDSVITIRRSDVHSEKPEDVRAIIVKHWTHGPYLELFGRKPVEGWDVFGNDARLWAAEVKAS